MDTRALRRSSGFRHLDGLFPFQPQQPVSRPRQLGTARRQGCPLQPHQPVSRHIYNSLVLDATSGVGAGRCFFPAEANNGVVID
jgi:hypothetical protein